MEWLTRSYRHFQAKAVLAVLRVEVLGLSHWGASNGQKLRMTFVGGKEKGLKHLVLSLAISTIAMSVYWLDLFTPSNWEKARIRGFRVTRFRRQRWPVVSRIKQGDIFVCYITNLGRFGGTLKALSSAYRDETITKAILDETIFPCIVDVEPIVAFDFLHSVPKAIVISKLSIAQKWGGLIRGCPVQIPTEDGELITRILLKSKKNRSKYPIMQKTVVGE